MCDSFLFLLFFGGGGYVEGACLSRIVGKLCRNVDIFEKSLIYLSGYRMGYVLTEV